MRNIFEISKSGLFAAQKSMATISQNIANANTPGYTRQRAELSAENLRQGSTTLGRGVSVDQVAQLRNALTESQIRLKDHEIGDLTERSRILQQMEAVFTSSTGEDLDSVVSDFFNAFSELSNNPQDINLRNITVSKAQAMIGKFKTMDGDLENIRDRVFDTAQGRVDKLNRLLNNLAEVNSDIRNAEATGQPDLGSKDKQAELLGELSKLVSVNTTFSEDGSVEARIGGIVVLNSEGASKIKAEAGPQSNAFRLRLENGKVVDPGKGELAADIYMYQEGIPDQKQALDKIANSIADQVNALHSTGFGLNDAIQRNFFNPSGNTAGTLALNQEIIDDPANIAASSVPGEPGNNDNALLIDGLRNIPVLDGQTLNTNIIQMLSKPGIKLNELEVDIQSKQSAKQLLVNQQQSESGVNIDEELSDLIKFQNAYQASARVLNAGQQMYDSLLRIV